ncbi:hypothetical protein [Agrobacterium tumefaciens]|uniref:hypothetical protein n=1 Tax=Agrobacterium tumefaciens TaxID=358 RepID=UPI00045AEDB8|nr:hypothetical protein [Agrobacterium tumefaciens]CDN93505.1 hypothetical protein BN949_02659 [Agrobacterium tumefaciens]
MSKLSFQDGVAQWMLECFGPAVIADKTERADRFIEEALELVQSVGYPGERVLALLSYVYGRSIGEPAQEVGGTMVALAAFCISHDIDMDEASKTELARVWTKIEAIRAKQAAKPTGSALPVPRLDNGQYPHADNEAVDILMAAAAAKMKSKLFLARRKGRSGWDDPTQCTNEDLSRMLREHVEKGDPVDVANFCAFLIARGERIGPAAYTHDPLEEHLKHLVTSNPEKALLAALDDNMRMWFVAELTGVAGASVPLTEIEKIVSRHLMPAKGGAA